MEQFTLFYGGPASQWYASNFVIDGVTYNCAEQYMMAMKALMFNDSDALDIIMNTSSPKIQKATGRLVKGFDKDVWEREARLIVYRANLAKFMQNANDLTWLLSTEGTTLVEASPWDTIWGIGLGADDPRCLDRAQWRGTNWLGELITKVRDDILAYQWATAGTDKQHRVKFMNGKTYTILPNGGKGPETSISQNSSK